MIYRVSFSDNSIQELEDAIYYYTCKSTTSLDNFKKQLNDVLNSLEINPWFQIKYKDVRAIPFKSLPFIVLYSINEKDKLVYIYSIFNTYQDDLKYPKK